MNTSSIKFNTHHFPVGTVVQFNEELRRMRPGDDGIRTVMGLECNGAQSYVINTGRKSCHADGTPFADEVINVDYVECIITRGDGPVSVDHSYLGTNASLRERIHSDLELMELRQPLRYNSWSDTRGFLGTVDWKPRKRNYNTGAIQTVLMFEVNRISPDGLMVDYSRMVKALFTQTWTHRINQKLFHITSVDKKRLRRWLKQNLNRFLRPMKELLKAEYKQHEEDMREVDREMDLIDADFQEERAAIAAAEAK